jgi:hypothetical protein
LFLKDLGEKREHHAPPSFEAPPDPEFRSAAESDASGVEGGSLQEFGI